MYFKKSVNGNTKYKAIAWVFICLRQERGGQQHRRSAYLVGHMGTLHHTYSMKIKP